MFLRIKFLSISPQRHLPKRCVFCFLGLKHRPDVELVPSWLICGAWDSLDSSAGPAILKLRHSDNVFG
jgi:hypothetical protein